jgi:uncharacterized membrane protein
VESRSTANRSNNKAGHDKRSNKKAHSVNSSGMPADRGIRAVAQLERGDYRARSRADHIAATITRHAGSGLSVVLHAVWFLLWTLVNIGALKGIEPFDPFPFSLLTTVVSLEAIFLTLFVLVAQNRMSHEADKRAELDLQINLLAEKETTMILRILNDISKTLGVKGSASRELSGLLKETRLDEISEKLEKALPSEE